MNSIDLNGRRAIVTGAAQGLGRAIGERLQASGAAVYVWDFDSCRYEGSPGGLARRVALPGWIEVDVFGSGCGGGSPSRNAGERRRH